LALTSPTGGGRSVGIVRLRTKATEFSFFFSLWLLFEFCEWLQHYLSVYGYGALVHLVRFSGFLTLYTVDRTTWTGDQPVARPLPTHRINAHTDIHASSGIRTHDPSVRKGEDRAATVIGSL
jgi:hypothetical protein